MKKTTILRLSVLLLLATLLLSLCACDLFGKPSKDTEPATGQTTDAPSGNTTAGNNGGSDKPSGETTGKPDTPDQPTSVTVRVIYNGADGFDGATSFDSAKGMTLGTPEKTGYGFDGWYRSEDFSGDPLTVIPVGETGTNGVLTLWAKWEPLTLTVNMRSGIPGQSQTRKKLAWGESMTLAAPTGTYEGHTFAGWKVGNNLYAAGETFTFDDETMTSVTLVGEWTVNNYEVRFTVDGQTTTESLPYGSALTKTAEKTGYRFLGWSLDPDATEATENLTVGAGNMTVYAVFRINTYSLTVKVEANRDGVTVPGLTSGTYDYGTVLDLPNGMIGYYLTYKVGETGTAISGSLTLTEDTVLTVIATPTKVKIRLAGDCEGMADLEVDYGSLLVPQLPETNAAGMDIVGWYLDENETEPVPTNRRVSHIGTLTIWARAAERRTCTFHYADGTTETVPLRFGSELGKTDSKVGHTFTGWADENGNRVEAMGDHDIEVWSTFTANSYKLTFDISPADDEEIGDDFAPITAAYGSKVTLPDGSALWYAYGTFAGWEYQGTVYASLAEITVGAGDAVITAKWNKTPIVIRFLDWDDTEIYRIETFKGDTFSIPHDSLIETVREFDRWQFSNEIGQTCIFRDNETVFTEDTVVVAKYCKIWIDKDGVKQKADLVYPTADSFYFAITSSKTMKLPDGTTVSIPTRYKISGQVVEDGVLTGAYIKQLPYDLCIPSTYNGAIVSSLFEGSASTKGAFATYVIDDKHQPNAIRFTSIFIPSAISHIPSYAFYGQYCDVTFGLDSKITTVGYRGLRASILGGGARNFYNFPEGLTTIANYGFGVDEYKACADWRWYLQDGTRVTALPESIQYIGASAFSNLNLFEEAYFGKNLKSLGTGAFYAMGSLKSITIDPDCPLKTIPANCFNTTGLTSVVIPASVETIGAGAFQNCLSLSSVTFAEGSKLKRIEDLAFYGFDNPLPITELRLPEGLEYIGEAAFAWHSGAIDGKFSYGTWHQVSAKKAVGPLTTLVLPSTLKEIGICAFAYQSITELTLPAALETIGNGAFYYCYNITAIDFSGLDNLKTIGGSAFSRPYDSKVMTPFTVVIPKNVETIGNYAFAGMTNLCGITFTGSKLAEIGEGAFGDTGLKDYRLILPEGLKKIGGQAFYFTELVYVWFPGSLEEIGYQAFFGSETLKEIYFEENPDSENGLKLMRDVFGGCKVLKSVTLPSQLIEMQGGILANQKDYNGVFAYCPELESVTFNGRTDGKADRALIIDTSVFYQCPKLSEIHIRRNTLIELRMVRGDSAVSNVMLEGCDASLTVYVVPAMTRAYMGDQNGWSGIFVSGGRAKLANEIMD